MDDNDDNKKNERRPRPSGMNRRADKPFGKDGRKTMPAGKPKGEHRRDERSDDGKRQAIAKPRRKEFHRGDKPFGSRDAAGFRSGRGEQREGRREPPERFEKPAAREGRPERRPFAKPAGQGFQEARGKREFERKAHQTAPREEKRGFKPKPLAAAGEAGGERIAKRLARAGIASRRDAEELIAAGRVKVNGKVLSSPAFNVMPGDAIHLDDTEIPPVERTRLFLFHKPAGVVTTSRDPQGRKTVFDVLPAELPRLMTVGRLDINTEGLLLLTNDGGLSRVLELPATGWLRRYRVRVHGKVEESALAGLREGIAVDGVFYGAVEATLDREQGSNAWLTLGLREGKNREVKNILGALGLDVTRLIRVSYGPFQLGELPEGHVLEIKGRMLREQLGERLIEESGANFEAEIVQPFSNKPVRRNESRTEKPEQRPKPARAPVGEGGLVKGRRRRENGREEALGKLTTKRERSGARGQQGGHERPESRPQGQRHANVWMAPGARPRGKDQRIIKQERDSPTGERETDRKPGAKPFAKKRDGGSGRFDRRDTGRTGPKPHKGPKGR